MPQCAKSQYCIVHGVAKCLRTFGDTSTLIKILIQVPTVNYDFIKFELAHTHNFNKNYIKF